MNRIKTFSAAIAIKGGNSCGWKGVNNSCSIKDLIIVELMWIQLLCTGGLLKHMSRGLTSFRILAFQTRREMVGRAGFRA